MEAAPPLTISLAWRFIRPKPTPSLTILAISQPRLRRPVGILRMVRCNSSRRDIFFFLSLKIGSL